MKVYVKMLQGAEKMFEVSGSCSGAELKKRIATDLDVLESSQRLVFKGKPITEETILSSVGIVDNSRIHLMVKKSESKSSDNKEQTDFYTKLDCLLRIHLTPEQTAKVISEFKKNFQAMIDSMNFDDIERFAASNCTHF